MRFFSASSNARRYSSMVFRNGVATGEESALLILFEFSRGICAKPWKIFRWVRSFLLVDWFLLQIVDVAPVTIP